MGAQPVYDDGSKEDIRPKLRVLEGGGDSSTAPSGQLSSVPGSGDNEDQDTGGLSSTQGGGETTTPRRGHLSAVNDDAKSLNERESTPDRVGDKGYTGEGKPKKTRGLLNNSTNRKRAGIAGLITGLLLGGGGLLLTPSLSLLNAMQWGNVVGKASHLSDGEHTTRISRAFRFMRSGGEVGVTRLSYVEYKMYPKMIKMLKDNGVSITTDKLTGQIKGMGFTAESLPEDYKGLTNEELRARVMQDYSLSKSNVHVKADGSLSLENINQEKVSIKRNLVKSVIKESSTGKISYAWNKRTIINLLDLKSNILHPFSAADAAIKNKFSTTVQGSDLWQSLEKSRLNELVKSASPARAQLASALESKVGKGVAAAVLITGVLCVVYNGIEDAAQATRDNVVTPGVASAADAQAVPAQAAANSPDITANQLDAYDANLNASDENGGTTFDAPAAVAEGSGGTVPAIVQDSQTQANLTNLNTAFAYQGDISNAVSLLDQQWHANTICSTAGLIVQAVVGIASLLTPGGWIAKGASTVGFGAGLYLLQDIITKSATTGVLSITPHFGVAGGQLDLFGGREYANIVERPSGFPLNNTQEQAVRTAYDAQQSKEFADKSLVARMFDPTDSRTLVGRLVQQNTGSVTGNIARSVNGVVTNVASLFRLPATLISGSAHAAPAPYAYPFPLISTPDSVLNDPRQINPYDNEAVVAQVLSSGSGQQYIDKAANCGINITHDTTWDFTLSDVVPNSPKYQTYGCYDQTDYNWVRIKSWVGYTQDLSGVACQLGDDASCDWLSGSSGSTATTASQGGFALPVDESIYTAHPDWFSKPHHTYPAADLPVPSGTNVYAIAGGKIISAPAGGGCGQGVIIDAGNGIQFKYCHGSDGGAVAGAGQGDTVTAGQLIMHSDNTGHSSGPHLHVEIVVNGKDVCPQNLLVALGKKSPTLPDITSLPVTGCYY